MRGEGVERPEEFIILLKTSVSKEGGESSTTVLWGGGGGSERGAGPVESSCFFLPRSPRWRQKGHARHLHMVLLQW